MPPCRLSQSSASFCASTLRSVPEPSVTYPRPARRRGRDRRARRTSEGSAAPRASRARSGASASCTRTSRIGSSPEIPRPQRRRLHGRAAASTSGGARSVGSAKSSAEKRRWTAGKQLGLEPRSLRAAAGSPARRRGTPSERRASSRTCRASSSAALRERPTVVTKASVTVRFGFSSTLAIRLMIGSSTAPTRPRSGPRPARERCRRARAPAAPEEGRAVGLVAREASRRRLRARAGARARRGSSFADRGRRAKRSASSSATRSLSTNMLRERGMRRRLRRRRGARAPPRSSR